MDLKDRIDSYHRDRLLELYPERIVSRLFSTDKKLYTKLKNYLKKDGIETKDYIESLGFEYKNGKAFEVNEESIFDRLVEVYPDGEIPSIGDLIEKDPPLYRFIREYVNTEEVNFTGTEDLLENFGFKIKGQRGAKYDTKTLKKLKEEYDFNGSQLADFLGVSKQLINMAALGKGKRSKRSPWVDNSLDPQEENLVLLALDKITNELEHKGTRLRIYRHKTLEEKFALLFVTDGEVKVTFDPPVKIQEKLVEKGFGKYRLNELRLRDRYFNDLDLGEVVRGTFKFKDEDFKSELKKELTARKRGESVKFKTFGEYVSFLTGDDYDFKKWVPSNEEAVQFLSEYANEDKEVRIPVFNEESTQNCDYMKAKRWMKKLNIDTWEEFCSNYGFTYREFGEEIKEDFSEELKKRVIHDNFVFIDTLDPLYSRLFTYSKRHKEEFKTMNDFISSLGYKRILQDQLPENSTPYDWREEDKVNNTLIRIEDRLKSLVNSRSNGESVYIEVGSRLYYNLVRLGSMKQISINELLAGWDLTREYNDHNLQEETEVAEKELNTIEDGCKGLVEEFEGSLLDEIKDIQGDLESKSQESNKVSRSRKLVSKLKQLYNFKCQLCSPDRPEIPVIEKLDGTPYVELHHIIPLAESKNTLDTDESEHVLDSYQNALIVCPYHHKYLHHFKGGNFTLNNINGVLCLTNKKGGSLEVKLNYHLGEEDHGNRNGEVDSQVS